MAKKGTPRNQRPKPIPENQKISRQQLDGTVTILNQRFADLAQAVQTTLRAYNMFIQQEKLPKEENK